MPAPGRWRARSDFSPNPRLPQPPLSLPPNPPQSSAWRPGSRPDGRPLAIRNCRRGEDLVRRLLGTIRQLRSIKERQTVVKVQNAERLAQVEARRKSLEQMSLEETAADRVDRSGPGPARAGRARRRQRLRAGRGGRPRGDSPESRQRPGHSGFGQLRGGRPIEQGLSLAEPAGGSFSRNAVSRRTGSRPIPGRASDRMAQRPGLAGPDRATQEMGADRPAAGERDRAADQRGARPDGRLQHRSATAEGRHRFYCPAVFDSDHFGRQGAGRRQHRHEHGSEAPLSAA